MGKFKNDKRPLPAAGKKNFKKTKSGFVQKAKLTPSEVAAQKKKDWNKKKDLWKKKKMTGKSEDVKKFEIVKKEEKKVKKVETGKKDESKSPEKERKKEKKKKKKSQEVEDDEVLTLGNLKNKLFSTINIFSVKQVPGPSQCLTILLKSIFKF